MAKDYFDIDIPGFNTIGKAIKKERIDIDYGGFLDDLPRIENSFMKDARKVYSDYKKGKQTVKQIKVDLEPGFIYATKQTRRGLTGLRKRFGKKQTERMHRPQFYVAYVQGGVMRKAQFTNKTQARAFREKYLASGVGDEVSNVIER